MSVEQLALVLHHSRAKGTDKLVLLGIANHAGDGGAWPSVATLAKYANTTERTVQRSLQSLVALGELIVHRQQGGLPGRPDWSRPNRYDVTVGCPVTCDRSPNHRERPLPTAQAELWTNPVTPTSPGDAHDTRPVTPTTPGPVTPASPEPSTQPNVNSGGALPQPQDARGSGDTPPCTECSAPSLDECVRRQAKLRTEDKHQYQPRGRAA